MCGSISGVLTFSLPQQTRNKASALAGYLAFYNLGRLLSYSAAGALAGAF
ncbi:MAG: sulfite exporter TauE/SafE family protein, partial [Gammaproteobacteria bacterium]|nr:sulfite exporter TauE/SafE family protein [Gammaproteobacteria bacterium]